MFANGGYVYHHGQYRYHVFTGTATLNVSEAGNVEVLLVAGGGGGGGGVSGWGGSGGGGAGGTVYNSSFAVSVGNYTVTIGGGGGGGTGDYRGANGGNTTFSTLTAIGGGGGGSTNNGQNQQNGANGGCGGGAGGSRGQYGGTGSQGGNGGTATDTSPYKGAGGGGQSATGGAGGNGTGAGGTGYYTTIRGIGEYFAGGGAGGRGGTPGAGGGGADGGGAGGANTGGGGGGCSNSGSMTGGTGGSGIAIIRYTIPTEETRLSKPNLKKRRTQRGLLKTSLQSRSFNVAFGMKTVGSDGVASTIPTDENLDSASYFGIGGSAYVTIDLQDQFWVDEITMWHYYADLRIYAYNSLQVSSDGTNWTTVFDSEVTGRYVETANGRTVKFNPMLIRYVRNNLNGSNVNTGSHWCEIKVMGYPR